MDISALKEELREELKAELRQEMKQFKRSPSYWSDLKSEIEPRLEKFNFDGYNHHQIISAISTIVRHSLGIRSVAYLEKDDVPAAKLIIDNILGTMEASRGTGTDGQ